MLNHVYIVLLYVYIFTERFHRPTMSPNGQKAAKCPKNKYHNFNKLMAFPHSQRSILLENDQFCPYFPYYMR